METTTGRRAERKAQAFLELQGLVTVTNNYHCAMGEIDIIMLHNNTLVFVEVRLRRPSRFGGAEHSITRAKQQKIRRTAEHFRKKYPDFASQPCRFDIVAFNDKNPESTKPNWLSQAF